jgi:hypothetical protein
MFIAGWDYETKTTVLVILKGNARIRRIHFDNIKQIDTANVGFTTTLAMICFSAF